MNINQQHDHSRTLLSYTRAVPDLIPYSDRGSDTLAGPHAIRLSAVLHGGYL
jgi:hypothetical protein